MLTKNFTLCTLILFTILMVSGRTNDDQGNTWGTNYTTCTYSQAYGYSHPGIIETNTQKLWVAWHNDNKLYLMKEK